MSVHRKTFTDLTEDDFDTYSHDLVHRYPTSAERKQAIAYLQKIVLKKSAKYISTVYAPNVADSVYKEVIKNGETYVHKFRHLMSNEYK